MFNKCILIDLSHALDEKAPSWDGKCGFEMGEFTVGMFRINRYEMAAGMGTHIDAPAHCIPGGASVDQLPLKFMPGAVIDVKCSADDLVSVRDIENFERLHGPIEPGSAVLIKTGWERFWGEPERYRHFPGVSKEAAEFLLNRQIAGLCIDTLSPDQAGSDFPVHQVLLGAGKFIVENAANLGGLPPKGSTILALPMKIKGGTESPVRLVGFV